MCLFLRRMAGGHFLNKARLGRLRRARQARHGDMFRLADPDRARLDHGRWPNRSSGLGRLFCLD